MRRPAVVEGIEMPYRILPPMASAGGAFSQSFDKCGALLAEHAFHLVGLETMRDENRIEDVACARRSDTPNPPFRRFRYHRRSSPPSAGLPPRSPPGGVRLQTSPLFKAHVC